MKSRAQYRLDLHRRMTAAFCPTGPGGGSDPTCSPSGGKSNAADVVKVEKINKLSDDIRDRATNAMAVILDTSADRGLLAKALMDQGRIRKNAKSLLDEIDGAERSLKDPAHLARIRKSMSVVRSALRHLDSKETLP